MIKISVNGDIKEIDENLNIAQLIEVLEYKVKGFAVAINMTFIPIAEYENIVINEGDKIDILSPVQGG
jgi:sulfur carrier protein